MRLISRPTKPSRLLRPRAGASPFCTRWKASPPRGLAEEERPQPCPPSHSPGRGTGACRSAPARRAAPAPSACAALRSHPGEPAACTSARRWWRCTAVLEGERSRQGFSLGLRSLYSNTGSKNGLLCAQTPIAPPGGAWQGATLRGNRENQVIASVVCF